MYWILWDSNEMDGDTELEMEESFKVDTLGRDIDVKI